MKKLLSALTLVAGLGLALASSASAQTYGGTVNYQAGSASTHTGGLFSRFTR